MGLILPFLGTYFLGVLTLVLVYHFVSWRFKPSKNPSAPEAAGAWPIVGHLPLLGGSSEPPHMILGKMADKYGPAFTLRLGQYQALILSKWDIAKEVFTTHDLHALNRPESLVADFLSYDFAMFGFSPYGRYWREIRKLISMELLSSRRLELLKHARNNEIEVSTKELYMFWNGKANGSSSSSSSTPGYAVIDMKEWFGNISLNTILRMIAGKRYFGCVGDGVDEEEARRIKRLAREIFNFAGLFLPADFFPILKHFDIGGYQKKMKELSIEIDGVFGAWLQEHRQKRESGDPSGDHQDFIDVMTSLLKDTKINANYDADTIIKSTCLNLVAGGSDTTGVTLTWALARIVSSPQILKKVREELDQHVGKDRRVIDSDIPNLVYLGAIIKETLRLNPPGPLGGPRKLSENCIIGGYKIPKGTRVIVNLWKQQRDPNVWPDDPLAFRPERFLTTHKHVDVRGQNFELIPFTAGRRNCPGMYFALQLIQLVLANLLHAFDFAIPAGRTIDFKESAGLINDLAGPLQLLVAPRLSANLY